MLFSAAKTLQTVPTRRQAPHHVRQSGGGEVLEQRLLMAADPLESDWLGALTDKLAALDGQAWLPTTIASTLPISSGYARSTVGTAAFTGTADPSAGSVLVAGLPATWNAAAGTWSIANVPLNPGINRIIAKAYAGPGGSGAVLNEAYLDVWYDSSATVSVPMGSIWKYHDLGQNLGTAWKEESYPAANTWSQGAGELGYGETDQSPTGEIGYGSDPANKFITSYFRHQFTIPTGDAAKLDQASVTILYDDGAVIYINGTEIGRRDLPASPATIDWTTRATINRDNRTQTISFSASLLHDGVNTIAVEIHQYLPDSSDLSFNLSLTATQTSATGTTVSGTLPVGVTTWKAENGPYRVTANVTVPVGATLVIEPGTTVFFSSATRINVNGTLQALGTDTERIRFTRVPGGARWGGLRFTNTLQDNQMAYFDQEYGDSQGYAIGVTSSKLMIDHATWAFANITVIEVVHPSLLVKNSHFPPVGSLEVIHGEHIANSEYLILDGNIFDKSTSGEDVVDFLGADRPGPVFQVVNNVFLGGSDDGLDLDGTDVQVEGNIFTGFHLGTTRPTTSNAIATGLPQTGETNRTQITVTRNLFYDNDHSILLKEDAFATVVNNVFASGTIAAIQFTEVGGTAVAGPGRGAYIDGNIFYATPLLFKNIQPTTQLVVNRSIVTAAQVGLGTGNLSEDPLFVDPANRNYRLQPASPAIGTGPNGRDMGAYVPAGASIAGEPASPTSATSATLTVGGPDIYAYKYRINGGSWSSEVATQNLESLSVSVPAIQLTGLTPGIYTVQVAAKNSAGVWQADASATSSKTWTVLPAVSVVGRHVFYNNSSFDGANSVANAADDAAIANDKQALLPGQTATLANYTSYSRGINGVMVDIAGRPAAALSASDFQFRVGNDNSPGGWSLAPAPASITVRTGAGSGGSDRVTLTWADGAIEKQWLQVTVLATAATGLAQPDVFYFGNAIGDTGDSPSSAAVNSTDELAARANAKTFLTPAIVSDNYDHNRDGFVNATDQILARSNSTTLATALKLISVPASVVGNSASASPEFLTYGDIATGLAAPAQASAESSASLLAASGSQSSLVSPGGISSEPLAIYHTALIASATLDNRDLELLEQPAEDEQLFELIAADLLANQL